MLCINLAQVDIRANVIGINHQHTLKLSDGIFRLVLSFGNKPQDVIRLGRRGHQCVGALLFALCSRQVGNVVERDAEIDTRQR